MTFLRLWLPLQHLGTFPPHPPLPLRLAGGPSAIAPSARVVHTALGDQGHLSLADRFGGVSQAWNLGTLRPRHSHTQVSAPQGARSQVFARCSRVCVPSQGGVRSSEFGCRRRQASAHLRQAW